jgi:hypothetical protein
MKTPSVDKPFYSQQRSLKHQRDLAVQNRTSKFHAQIGIEICNELPNTADALPKNDRASLSAASADFAASSKPKAGQVAEKDWRRTTRRGLPAPKPALAIHNAVLERLRADVAELVDARDLKSLDGNVVWVRVPPPAPINSMICSIFISNFKFRNLVKSTRSQQPLQATFNA